jgi:hypothetical protein
MEMTATGFQRTYKRLFDAAASYMMSQQQCTVTVVAWDDTHAMP